MTALKLQIIETTSGWIADVDLAPDTHRLLGKQFDHCLGGGGEGTFARWLASALNSALPQEVAYELRPPSGAQISFATAIARGLSIPLVPDVLRYRGSMHAFLTQHAESFRKRSQ